MGRAEPLLTPVHPLAAAAYNQLIQMEAAFDEQQRAWSAALPVEAAIDAIDAVEGGVAYNPAGPGLTRIVDEAGSLGGDAWSATYLRMVMLRLMGRGLEHPPVTVPPAVAELQARELTRILEEDAAKWLRRYRLTNRRFKHDLDFCRHRLVHLGTVVGVTGAWLPARVRRAFPEAPPAPWLALHVRAEHWSQKDEPASRRRIASFLDANPHYAGAFGVSWMNDPALAQVAPHQFARTAESLAHGARVFEIGSNAKVVRLALATSETRRRCYEAGTYVPTDYALVWPRHAMFSWARAGDIGS